MFHTRLTDLDYVVTIRDTQTGAIKTCPAGPLTAPGSAERRTRGALKSRFSD